ncbi:hypothetical protein [Leisingera sp. M523]|uniref:hypothetical protein n=1 Tax=Leisingera sp. M523 TaxID=2867013 RepID=UPI0021A51E5A|nr:hypothetical protein [Leisingera sp. M523]UWQ28024.1 hypothetical protein K3557_14730 [Leisingera sp. M523]
MDNYGDIFGLSRLFPYNLVVLGECLKIRQFDKALFSIETFRRPCQGFENKGTFVTLP